MGVNHDILLEVGTNEFEIVEFLVNADKKHYFGINVAKVREIIKMPDIIKVPDSHPAVVGTANVRQKVIPIINLGFWLNLKFDFDEKTAKVIVTYFNHQYNGFIVDDITRIHRITWADIKDYSSISDFRLAESVLGVVDVNKRLVQLLDFEKIVSEINPNDSMENTEVDTSKFSERQGKMVFMAEDSTVIRKMLKNNIESSGYEVKSFENGQNLLKALNDEIPDLILTDLEMPVADGTFLIRKVRESELTKDMPIIVFSSLASEENEKKVAGIGANEFIGKPDLGIVISTIDKYLLEG